MNCSRCDCREDQAPLYIRPAFTTAYPMFPSIIFRKTGESHLPEAPGIQPTEAPEIQPRKHLVYPSDKNRRIRST